MHRGLLFAILGIAGITSGWPATRRSFARKKRVFISFDYDHDRNYRYLLPQLKGKAGAAIDFADVTPEEIRSDDVGRVKAVLTGKIRSATHTLVIVGKHANSYHPDRARIGERNWQWWEIKQSRAKGKKLIAVKIDRSNYPPTPLLNAGAKWAFAYRVESILKAIDEA